MTQWILVRVSVDPCYCSQIWLSPDGLESGTVEYNPRSRLATEPNSYAINSNVRARERESSATAFLPDRTAAEKSTRGYPKRKLGRPRLHWSPKATMAQLRDWWMI